MNFAHDLVKQHGNTRHGETLEYFFAMASEERVDEAVLQGLLCCLREEYGDTYIDKRVYDLDWLREETAAGRLLTAVAFSGNREPVACICLRENPPYYGVGDLSMHVVRKAFRGCGISVPLVKWIMRLPETARFSALGAHNATFHAISQRESDACGLRPCGMLLNLYRSQGFVHSHANIGEKLSYLVATKPLDRSEVTICPPAEHRGFMEDYYRSVDVPVRFQAEGEVPSESELEAMQDENHHTLTLLLNVCGQDLETRAAALLERYRDLPFQTVTACLDLTHPAAPWGYRVLTGLGFRFSGLQPFCRGRQYLWLHHPLAVTLPFDKMYVAPTHEGVFRYVRKNFEAGGKSV